jgi:hypothetical protein
VQEGGIAQEQTSPPVISSAYQLKWTRMDSNGLEWTRMDSNGLEWTRMDSNGLEWTRMDSNGPFLPQFWSPSPPKRTAISLWL